MTTGVVSTLKLNLSQHPEIKAFNEEGPNSAKKNRRKRHHVTDTKQLERGVIGVGSVTLIGLLALWKFCQMSPEKGLLRSINAQSIPILSNLRLPKSGMSLVDITSTLMTTITSGSSIFFAALTHQHVFERIGTEALTRLSTLSLIKAVKGGKNKQGVESIFSINRWFLNYMMEPKNLTRKIDTPLKESAWVQFNNNWRNTVGLAIQEMCGLNTPFEVMFPLIKEAPTKAGTLVDKEIDAFRQRLTLETTELEIYETLTKGITIKKDYTKAKQAFDEALAQPHQASTLTTLYEALADAQYRYNHHFKDLRYEHGVNDPWVGRESRHAYEEAIKALTGHNPERSALSEQTRELWQELDAPNEKKNKLTLIPLRSDMIDWQKALTELGQGEAQKSLQSLRNDLKLVNLYPLLTERLEKVLMLDDETKGIPKDAKRRLEDIFMPYLKKEATKYAVYDPAHLDQVKALKKKQPNIPMPINLDDSSDEGTRKLFLGLLEDFDSLNPEPELVRPREMAMKKAFGISDQKPLTEAKKLELFRERAHQRLKNYVDLKEEQNLTLNYFSSEATQTYNELIKAAIEDYMEAQAKSSDELKLDFYLARRFGEARSLNTEKAGQNKGAPPRLLTGKVFNILDAGFKLNERINDIDQYKNNNLIKSILQVGFQTVVTAFILSNVLFFIVYNSFSRLDADYKGHGKIPLSDWITSIKGFLGLKEEKEKDKTPLEGDVNISLNLNENVIKQGNHTKFRRKHKSLPHTKGESTL
jgi:hypothetical protein